MKSEYLLDLLRQHSRVIIPNFGAFLLKTKPQSDDTSDLQISFNDFLKFNDGLLIDHVAQTEEIDKFEAEHQVKDFVSKIQYNLINEGAHVLEGLGTISKDEKGGLIFEKSGSDSLKPSEPEQQKVSMTGLTPLSKEKEPVKKSTPLEQSKPNFEIPQKETVQPKRTAPKPIPSEDRPQPNPVSKPSPQPTAPKPKPKQKKKKLLPIWRHVLIIGAVLAIVVVILFLAGFFDSPDKQAEVNKNQIANSNQTELNEPNIHSKPQAEASQDLSSTAETEVNRDPQTNVANAKQEIENQSVVTKQGDSKKVNSSKAQASSPKQVKPQNKTPQTVIASGANNYHIIDGSYADKGKAYDRVLKLRNKGFNSRIVNKVNGNYRVSYNSYPTWNAAKKELDGIRNRENAKAWILKHYITD